MKPILLLIFISTISLSQISNVRQKVENGRVIINYDLSGNYNGLTFTVQDAQGKIYTPYAYAPKDDITPGKDKYIWWEPQLEGLSVTGWKVTLTVKRNNIWTDERRRSLQILAVLSPFLYVLYKMVFLEPHSQL